MFETLFKYPGVLRRHKEGPLAAKREAYLNPTGNSRHGAGNDLAPVFLLFMYCYRTSTMARGVEYPCLLHLLNISTSPFIYFMPNDTRPCTWPAHLLPVFFS